VWRRPLREDPAASVRVLAKTEAGAIGPEEYAVGITTKQESQLYPQADEGGLFTGLSFAEAHWVAAVLASAATRADDAEALLFELRVPVDLSWRDIELAAEVIEPGGIRSGPLVPWEAEEAPSHSRYAIATYTLDCGHQAVEPLREVASPGGDHVRAVVRFRCEIDEGCRSLDFVPRSLSIPAHHQPVVRGVVAVHALVSRAQNMEVSFAE